MGEIVGAGLVAHVPTIMLPEETRLEINDGKEITLVPGLRRLRTEVLDRLEPDTYRRDGHALGGRRSSTSSRRTSGARACSRATSCRAGCGRSPTTCRATPSSPTRVAAQADGRDDTWVLACDDPYLPIFYGTVNIWTLPADGDERWVSVGINQCGTTEDFLLLGRADRAGGRADRSARGAARERRHDPPVPPVPRAARRARARRAGQHHDARGARGRPARARCCRRATTPASIDWMPEYRKCGPEGHFGHYLIMAGAIGGARCQAPGELFSEYEASVGTGQVHVWFERPADGWTGRAATGARRRTGGGSTWQIGQDEERATNGSGAKKLSLVDVVAQSVGFMGPVFSAAFLIPLIVGVNAAAQGGRASRRRSPCCSRRSACSRSGGSWRSTRSGSTRPARCTTTCRTGSARTWAASAGWLYYGGTIILTTGARRADRRLRARQPAADASASTAASCRSGSGTLICARWCCSWSCTSACRSRRGCS